MYMSLAYRALRLRPTQFSDPQRPNDITNREVITQRYLGSGTSHPFQNKCFHLRFVSQTLSNAFPSGRDQA